MILKEYPVFAMSNLYGLYKIEFVDPESLFVSDTLMFKLRLSQCPYFDSISPYKQNLRELFLSFIN